MKILYFAATQFPNPKSDSIQMLGTATGFTRQNVAVDMIGRKVRGSEREILERYGLNASGGLRLRRYSPTNAHLNRWAGRRFRFDILTRLLREKLGGSEPVLYVRGSGKALDFINRIGPWARRMGIPVLYEVHAIQYLDLKQQHRGRYGAGKALAETIRLRQESEALAYENASGLIVISRSLEAMLRQEFEVRCPTLIAPSGVNLEAFYEVLPLKDRDLDLVYVGGLFDFNGVEFLIRAMRGLPGRQLTVVGSGEREDLGRLEDEARAAGVADGVRFTDHVTPPEALAYMKRARVLVAPLRKGAVTDRIDWCSPAKLVEYLASGALIVASRLPAIEEVLQHERNALLCEPNDPDALAAAIRRGLEEEALADRLTRQSRADSKQYGFDQRAERILEFVRTLRA